MKITEKFESSAKYYAVKYAGDAATGTSDEWQIWPAGQLAEASDADDIRVLESHELVNAHQFLAT